MEIKGIIEVDMFSEKIDSPDHPEVNQFRELLETAAEEYDCSLLSFNINHGTVSFSFDNDELMARFVKMIRNDRQSGP